MFHNANKEYTGIATSNEEDTSMKSEKQALRMCHSLYLSKGPGIKEC